MGSGSMAESITRSGVTISALTELTKDILFIAVLRSQVGFTNDRQRKLLDFVNLVASKKKGYDFVAAITFPKRSADYFETQLDFIRENYGKFKSPDEFAEQRFFCSAFVVACLAVAGIIGEEAQVAYQPEHFSPGHLHRDVTFGWLLGFLVLDGGGPVPEDDPVLTEATRWVDIPGPHWWS
jgi:hypothetical protein